MNLTCMIDIGCGKYRADTRSRPPLEHPLQHTKYVDAVNEFGGPLDASKLPA